MSENYLDKLGPVKDKKGNDVTNVAEPVIVDFEARDLVFRVAVDITAYSVAEVLKYQRRLGEQEDGKTRNKAREELAKVIAESTDRPLIDKLTEIQTLLPEFEAGDSESDFKEQCRFLLIGAKAWNVPHIELTEEGLLKGEFDLVMSAVKAISATINPTSEEAEPKATGSGKSLSTGSPSTAMSEAAPTTS